MLDVSPEIVDAYIFQINLDKLTPDMLKEYLGHACFWSNGSMKTKSVPEAIRGGFKWMIEMRNKKKESSTYVLFYFLQCP